MEPSHSYVTSRDGTKLHVVEWAPEGACGTVLVVHGLAEHAARYDHVARALTQAGYRVLVLELRGHGDSEGKRGHVDAWSDYGDDLEAALTLCSEPCILLAHSMGGLVVLDRLGSSLDQDIQGVVLTNPLLGVRVQAPAIKLWLAGLLSKLLPRLSLSNELDTEHISRDPEIVKAYRDDPRVYSTITPRWYMEMTAAMARVADGVAQLSPPLLMVTSDADQICDPDMARQIADAYGGPSQQLRYPELYHEVLNEPEKEQVLADILAWLQATVSPPSA